MMRALLALLGLIDLNAALFIIAIISGAEIPVKVLIFISLLLFIKGGIFITDPASLIDIVTAVLIVLSIFAAVPHWILFIGAALIGFKGFRSFGV